MAPLQKVKKRMPYYTSLQSLYRTYSWLLLCQRRLLKIPGYGSPKPCQTCNISESYTPKINPIYHNFIGCPLATFMVQICEMYSVAIFGHKVIIDLNGIILLENTLKSQRRIFYTIALLYQLYGFSTISNLEESLSHASIKSSLHT